MHELDVLALCDRSKPVDDCTVAPGLGCALRLDVRGLDACVPKLRHPDGFTGTGDNDVPAAAGEASAQC